MKIRKLITRKPIDGWVIRAEYEEGKIQFIELEYARQEDLTTYVLTEISEIEELTLMAPFAAEVPLEVIRIARELFK